MARNTDGPLETDTSSTARADTDALTWRCYECEFKVTDKDRPLYCPHCERVDDDLPLGVDLFGVTTEHDGS